MWGHIESSFSLWSRAPLDIGRRITDDNRWWLVKAGSSGYDMIAGDRDGGTMP